MSLPLIQVKQLVKYFPVKKLFFTVGLVHAVDGVSLEIARGETFGLVGESGSGKTTLGRLLLRLLTPTSGDVLYNGKSVFELHGRELKEFRRKAQIVFQDPYTSLNPRMSIYDILAEPIEVHKIEVPDKKEYIVKLLETVGLGEEHLYRYPHEFSGGQKQRIAIARVLALRPEFIVLDEPTSALDVSVQAQILNMLKELQSKFKFTYLFISHDLSVVKFMSHRIAVMYVGKIIEVAPSDDLFSEPLHPYTQMLLSALPVPDPKYTRSKQIIKPRGQVPSALSPPPGCRFHPRCPFAEERCKAEEPELRDIKPNRLVACHLYS